MNISEGLILAGIATVEDLCVMYQWGYEFVIEGGKITRILERG